MLLKLLFSDLPKIKALRSCQEAPLSPQAPPSLPAFLLSLLSLSFCPRVKKISLHLLIYKTKEAVWREQRFLSPWLPQLFVRM